MQKDNRFKWLDVITITFTHFIHDVYTFFLPPLQIILMEKLAINNFMFGLLSMVQRTPTLLNPFIGIVAERLRMRYLMIFAPFFTALFMSLIGVVPNFTTLCIIIFLSGLSSSLFHVPTPVMIRHISGDKTGKGMSFYMFGGNFARTLSPVIILGVVELWGLNGILNLIPAGALASLILFIRYRKVDLRKDFKKADLPSEGSYIEVFRKYAKLLISIVSITLFTGLLKSCITYFLVGYLEMKGFNPVISKLGLTIVYLSGSLGVFASGTVSDYIGKRTTVLLCILLAPVFMLIFIHMSGNWQLPFLALSGFFTLATVPVFLSIVNSIDSKHLPFLNGTYMTINFLASASATLLVGWGNDMLGYQQMFLIGTILSLLAVPFALMLPKK